MRAMRNGIVLRSLVGRYNVQSILNVSTLIKFENEGAGGRLVGSAEFGCPES